MTIHQRIELLINELGMNKNSFSNSIGANPTILHNIIKGRNAPSFDLMTKIVSSFDNINPSWLLTGEGPMLKSSSREDNGVIKESPPGECPYCREKEKLISAQHRTIDILERELERCQHQLDHNDNARHRKDDGQKRKAG